jgi:hypothetical protein
MFAHQNGESVKSITSLVIMTCGVSGMSITALCEQGGVRGGALRTSVVSLLLLARLLLCCSSWSGKDLAAVALDDNDPSFCC